MVSATSIRLKSLLGNVALEIRVHAVSCHYYVPPLLSPLTESLIPFLAAGFVLSELAVSHVQGD